MASPNSIYFSTKTIFGLLMLAISFGSSQSNKLEKPFSTSLKALCDTTPYPKTCYDNLSPLVNTKNNYDSQFLYNLSVQVSIDELSRVSKSLSQNKILTPKLQNAEKLFSQSAIESCHDFLSLALYNLNLSLPTGGGRGLTTHETRNNFRTWLSAAGAHLQTCINELKYTPDEVRNFAITNLDKSTKLITTSLVIIGKIDDYMGSHEVDTIEKITSSELIINTNLETRKPDAEVAGDGSGRYRTITEAIEAVPEKSNRRFVIYVKKGVYYENVRVDKEKWNVMIYGDGMEETIVSSDRSNRTGTTTVLSATFAVYGKGFIAMDIGFRNTAGPANGQAVAFLSASDQSVFYRCLIDGYQDTLYTQSNRQFYRECNIYGTTDFIFGDSAVVFQNCNILVRRSLPSKKIAIITAQGKDNPQSKTGISIQGCSIGPAEDLGRPIRVFLGRPWKDYSTTVVMQSRLDGFIDPKGWRPWSRESVPPSTLFYVEYNNEGPGAVTTNRVRWSGVRLNNTENDAEKFTVRSFIDGVKWIPSTGVPFQADL